MTMRVAATPVPRAAARTGQRWAIVGGGILGMELSRQLRAQGRDVTLFEAAPNFGGLADAWSLGPIVWDRHYHVTLLSDLRLRALLEELGLSEQLRFAQTRTGFFCDGRLYSMSNTLEFLRFPPLGWLDKLRLGGTIVYASRLKNWRRLEGVPVLDWLRRWSGRRTTERLWQPLLRAKLGEQHVHASAAFIWAIIARMYAARNSGMKREMFGYVRGGYARILDAFVQKLAEAGVHLRPNCPVQRIECTPLLTNTSPSFAATVSPVSVGQAAHGDAVRGQAKVGETTIGETKHGETARGEVAVGQTPHREATVNPGTGRTTPASEATASKDRLAGPRWLVHHRGGVEAFDCVVVTAAAPVLCRLVPQLPPAERDAHLGIRYQGIVCASMVLKEPLAEFYVTNITDSWVPFTAVIEMTALVAPAEFGGRRLVYLPKYVAPDDPIFEESDASIQRRFEAALGRMYSHFRPEMVEAFRVSRVRHVLAISTLHYSRRLPPMASALPGLFAVNSSQICHGTLNVNETLLLADRAVTEVLTPVHP